MIDDLAYYTNEVARPPAIKSVSQRLDAGPSFKQDELITEEYAARQNIAEGYLRLSPIEDFAQLKEHRADDFIISRQARLPDFFILERKLSSRRITGRITRTKRDETRKYPALDSGSLVDR